MVQSRVPIYRMVADQLYKEIESGAVAADSYLPSERDLAETFHCSRIAVRQALQELHRLGLVEPQHGRGYLVVGNRQTSNLFIGVVTPYLPIHRSREIVYGVEKRLSNCDVMVANTLENDDLELTRIKAFLNRQVDGLIVVSCPSFANLEFLEEVARQVPLVIADRAPMHATLPIVRADDEAAAEMAVSYLIEKGHRNVACISRSNYIIGEERVRGYRKAMLAHQLEPIEPVLVGDQRDAFQVYRACLSLLSASVPPSAVVVYDDSVAKLLYEAANDLCLPIPDHLSVISLSNTDISTLINPQLTALDRNQVEVGEQAADLLLQFINEGRMTSDRLFVKPRLIERQSVSVESPA
jgi:GntR family transcriptional regulator of arabinose operon